MTPASFAHPEETLTMFGQMWWWGSGQQPKYKNQEHSWRRMTQHTNYKFVAKDEVAEQTRQIKHDDHH